VLARTSKVTADVTHVSLSIEQGAQFEGFSRKVATIEAGTHETVRPPRLNAPSPPVLGEPKPA
jgi:cytoskeletal protein CcmA (bactofilin family)